jgi:hypothetical protein
MNKKTQAILKSYARGVLTAIVPLLTIRSTDLWAYVAAIVAGVIAPALRALDKNDPAFGVVADLAVEEANAKVAKPTAKK